MAAALVPSQSLQPSSVIASAAMVNTHWRVSDHAADRDVMTTTP